jgi:hypothetical protein
MDSWYRFWLVLDQISKCCRAMRQTMLHAAHASEVGQYTKMALQGPGVRTFYTVAIDSLRQVSGCTACGTYQWYCQPKVSQCDDQPAVNALPQLVVRLEVPVQEPLWHKQQQQQRTCELCQLAGVCLV